MKHLIAFVWILSLLGTLLYGHDFGFVEGQQFQKKLNAEKLNQCNQIIARSIYE